MFYLLEDNRIIDSNDIRHFEEDDYLKTLDTFLEEIKVIGKIKKQSENVFDLIEKGDLIKYQFINGYYELVSTIELVIEIDIVFKQKEYIGVLGKDVDKNKNSILAIYKPDEKGNYIKVWEKKDE